MKRFDVSPVGGRVRYAVDKGRVKTVTVECSGEKKAYGLSVPSDVRIMEGDWVRISGYYKLEPLPKKEGVGFKLDPYWHDPHDGSNKEKWSFYELRDPVWEVLGPANLMIPMEEVRARIGAHIQNWPGSSSRESLMETARILSDLSAALRGHVSGLSRAPTPSVLEISVD